MVVKRNSGLYVYFRPFKTDKIGIKMPEGTSKTEAKAVEVQLTRACRTGDYGWLDSLSREVCIRMFSNRGWELPAELKGGTQPEEELTLWNACKLVLQYPEIREHANRERLEHCFSHVVEHFGKGYPVKSMWIPQVKEYQLKRLAKGAAPATVNREKSSLSKLFQVLVELQHIEVNPCRLVKPLSEKSGQRHAYISHADFLRIVEAVPEWFAPVVQVAYYTGMRKGEILGLTWKDVDLKKRIIRLSPADVKERSWKRVPIHSSLVTFFGNWRSGRVVGLENVFLHNSKSIHDRDQVRWAWDRKVCKLGLDPEPNFHDLRHTWKVNARRSGMHPEIEKAIMGHSQRGKSIHEGYGIISDEELIKAIDGMSFDHGDTEIWLARKTKPKVASLGKR